VIDHGRVIARGDSRSLKRQIGGDQLEVVPLDRADLAEVAAILTRVTGHEANVDEANRHVTARTSSGVEAVADLANALAAAQIAVEDVGLHQPSLDDVFMTLTGGHVDESAPSPEESIR